MSQTMPMETANIPDTEHESVPCCPRHPGNRRMDVGGTDDAQTIATIKSAIDRGITLIDTAPAYGFGHAEELVGQALAEAGARDKVCIATKVGLDWDVGKVFRNASRARISKEVEDLLRRLRNGCRRHLPGALAGSEDADRRDRRGDARAVSGGEDSTVGVSNFSVAPMEVFGGVAPLHTAQPPRQSVRARRRG